MKYFVLLVVVIVFSSCTSLIEVTQLKQYEKRHAGFIEVFRNSRTVEKPYEEIAIMKVKKGWVLQDQHVIDEYRKEAMKMGADAIILDDGGEGGMNITVNVGGNRANDDETPIGAIAIRYK